MQTLAALNDRYRNPHGVAIVYLLGWLAGCDGKIDEKETTFLIEFSTAILNDPGAANLFLPLIRRADPTDIIVAARQLMNTADRSNSHLLFELTLAMAMADGVFSVGENHIIRFFADILGLTKSQFVSSFRTVTGRDPQDPSDLSKASWWHERDWQRRVREAQERESKERERHEQKQRRQSSQGKSESSQNQGNTSPPPPAGGGSRRADALKHLGLGPGATIEEIKSAYKRLAKVHHPDRFEGLSVEIIEAANLSFRRIREAYEYLT